MSPARASVLLIVAVAACGYDWTVVPKDGPSSSSSSGGASSGKFDCYGQTCISPEEYCWEQTPGAGKCIPWTCSAANCTCEADRSQTCEGTASTCNNGGDTKGGSGLFVVCK